MAHVLLGWELGGNRGHAVTLSSIADELRGRGHRVSFALQRIDAIAPEAAGGAAIWPAPVTPRLLIHSSKPRTSAPTGMGDILGRLGLDDPAIVEGLIRGWRLLLDAIRPDLVISDYGPFLLSAARGRFPTVAIGTGFGVPPSGMVGFPDVGGGAPAYCEDDLLGLVNRVLTRLGDPALSALPELFAASRELAATFDELDPYRDYRLEGVISPALSGGAPAIAAGGGEEIFVYAPEQIGLDAPLWQGLREARLPVRCYVAGVGESFRAQVRGWGFAVESAPVPFARIAQRSRLLLSHGGHGFVCSGLLAGLPQIICHLDLEKLGYARAVTGLGLGGMVPLRAIEPAAFARSLVAAYGNEEIAARARAAAPAFQARCRTPMPVAVADAVDALV